ncbi:MurR/RpiR family transcriptional regulator [Acidimangrovimonas pyrenivorans]|uniref:MurR/RpiR family transcriptional regulator n=1 Tax=Acidimangrovimonas pyrenivorans TaxID=2030798 RepID=A0ABV7AL32_9RHOB
MTTNVSITDRIAAEYGGLSAKLREAADYVAAHPLDVASRSLRAVSASSGLAPVTFSRLARALGFDSYEELRELSRDAVGQSYESFSDKAGRLQAEAADGAGPPFLARQAAACVANIEGLSQQIDQDRLEEAVDRLHRARQVVLFGGFSSSGIAEYMAYMGSFFSANWSIAGRVGTALSTAMVDIGPEDALIVITKPPFARRAIMAAQMAAKQGAYVVAITDTHTCPALKHASAGFILSSESPQFFSSYAATLVLIETMIGMLVARGGRKAQARIGEVEARNRLLDEFWRG